MEEPSCVQIFSGFGSGMCSGFSFLMLFFGFSNRPSSSAFSTSLSDSFILLSVFADLLDPFSRVGAVASSINVASSCDDDACVCALALALAFAFAFGSAFGLPLPRLPIVDVACCSCHCSAGGINPLLDDALCCGINASCCPLLDDALCCCCGIGCANGAPNGPTTCDVSNCLIKSGP